MFYEEFCALREKQQPIWYVYNDEIGCIEKPLLDNFSNCISGKNRNNKHILVNYSSCFLSKAELIEAVNHKIAGMEYMITALSNQLKELQ